MVLGGIYNYPFLHALQYLAHRYEPNNWMYRIVNSRKVI